MPTRDSIHNIVKQAIIKDGWKITDDPYVISYGERCIGESRLEPKRIKFVVIQTVVRLCRLRIEALKPYRGWFCLGRRNF
ncbi:element excision factor XisH family protein [Nostoc sp.]|uniref:element excision factor XisH family protein n=1 Tax=Nostoc sp. TaxID=1180 RepID=UPI003FA5522B